MTLLVIGWFAADLTAAAVCFYLSHKLGGPQ